MKIYAIYGCKIIHDEYQTIFDVYDLSDINYFYRLNAKEFIVFTIKNILNNIDFNIKTQIEAEKYYFHILKIKNGYAITIVTDYDYPAKLCKLLLDDLINNFINSTDINILQSYISTKLIEFQNINECNTIYKIQLDLENTKENLIKTIGLVIDRGEKLDELVKKSEDLSKISKEFYDKSKKLNCCGLF